MTEDKIINFILSRNVEKWCQYTHSNGRVFEIWWTLANVHPFKEPCSFKEAYSGHGFVHNCMQKTTMTEDKIINFILSRNVEKWCQYTHSNGRVFEIWWTLANVHPFKEPCSFKEAYSGHGFVHNCMQILPTIINLFKHNFPLSV